MISGRTFVTLQATAATRASEKSVILDRQKDSMSLLPRSYKVASGPHPRSQSSSGYHMPILASAYECTWHLIQSGRPRPALLDLPLPRMPGIGSLKEKIEIGHLCGP